jgi:hypothetical protein
VIIPRRAVMQGWRTGQCFAGVPIFRARMWQRVPRHHAESNDYFPVRSICNAPPERLRVRAMAEESKQQQMKIQVKYEDMTARYASQVVLTSGQEELFLDFSSGLIPDQGSGASTLPIHTRIAMSAGGARRLHQVLTQYFQKAQKAQEAQTTQEVQVAAAAGAKKEKK